MPCVEQKEAGMEYKAMELNQYNLSRDEWYYSSQEM